MTEKTEPTTKELVAAYRNMRAELAEMEDAHKEKVRDIRASI